MEIHPPEGAVRSLKDFVVHLSMITLGILIALALDGARETLHHRQQIRELRASFRAEISENRAALVQWASALGPVTMKIEDALARSPQRDAGQPGAALSELGDRFVALKAGARDVALSTGTLNLLDLHEVHRYANAYTAQRTFEERQSRLEAVWFELEGAQGESHPTDADERSGMSKLRVALAYLRSLRQLEQEAIIAYDEALQVSR